MVNKSLETKLDKILMPVTVLVITGMLLILIVTGYDKYSYNQGFYEGLNAFCEEKGIIIINDNFECAENHYKNKFSEERPSSFEYETFNFTEVDLS